MQQERRSQVRVFVATTARRSLAWVLVLAAALLAVGWAGRALAQDAKGGRSGDAAEARRLAAEGNRLYDAQRYDEALPLFARALEIREKVLGPNRAEVGESASDLGSAYYRAKQDYVHAESLLKRGVAIREKALGPDHPDVAKALTSLAVMYFMKGETAHAEPLLQRALAIREKALAPDDLDLAESLHNVAVAYKTRQDDASAIPLLVRAVAIREKKLGPDSLELAGTQTELGNSYRNLLDFAHAEPLLENALRIQEKAHGPDHPDVAGALANVAWIRRENGDYPRAESLYARALAIREKAFGSESPEVARSLNDLADVDRLKGDYAGSEPLFRRALAFWDKASSPDPMSVAQAANNFALLYEAKFDYPSAEPLCQRALGIYEKALGPDHPYVASSLNNLGQLYRLEKDYARAEPLYQRAIAIAEKAFGRDSVALGPALNNLALLYRDEGDNTRAEPIYQRALSIFEKAFGPDHPNVAMAVNNLAMLYKASGDYTRAEPLFQRALAIREKALGPDHPYVASSLIGLAELYAARGETAKAVDSLTRGLDANERHVARVLSTGSERARRTFLDDGNEITDFAVSLHAQHAADDQGARHLALLAVLRRKGRVLDVMTSTFDRLHAHMTPDAAAQLDQLRTANSQIARETFARPDDKTSPEDHAKRLASLRQQADSIETDLAARSADYQATAERITIEGVQRAIPKDAVLVELTLYEPYDPRGVTATDTWGAPRYAAYGLRSTGQIAYQDLGEAAPIEALVAKVRAAFADPASDPSPPARALDELVGRPLRAIAGDAAHILLAPDGALNLVPFGALVDERGDFLVGRYVFTYLTTGRDLLRLGTSTAVPTTPPLVVAGPDFGPLPATTSAHAVSLRDATFPPLPGTAQEGHAIAALLPGALELEGAAATKPAVIGVHSPSVLHIATHGFFIADAPATSARADRGVVVATGGIPASSAPNSNPLLRSGLAFAGANLHRADDDGVMTALEASALDLWGTKLVVLSACETGVGEVRKGEGLFGLRRALVLAGAQSQVMSLWKVDDAATRDLMVGYYTALESGGGRTEALREAQLAMLGSKEWAHPFFWASFIPSGDWLSLDGKDVPVRVVETRAPALVRVNPGACGCDAVGRGAREELAVWACGWFLAVAARLVSRSRRRQAPVVYHR
jgi:CHAT domain-containing protein/tetratricopeptide (TPR) repeat protein